MPRLAIILTLPGVTAIALSIPLSGTASAQTVWSGLTFNFVKANDASPTLPENQDRITDNVWLSRDVQTGLFNVHDETAFTLSSPEGTEWATYINNPSEMIAATNWADLTFEPWIAAYGGQGGMSLPGRLTGGNAVVHLITDDIYLDLKFTGWTPNQGGGGFSYDRAVAPLTPATTGDYNKNGFVDAADYVFWRKTLNQSADPEGSGADGNESGTIDDGDYVFWTERFGNLAPMEVGAGALAVPEPSAAGLAFLGLLSMRLFSRRPAGRLATFPTGLTYFPR